MSDYLTARQRPVGVTLLSVLALVGAAGFAVVIAVAVYFFSIDDVRVQEAREAMLALGVPVPLLGAGIALLAVLAAASGVGMWIGAKWGWYLGSFWYAYAIVRNASALVGVFQLAQSTPPEELAHLTRGPAFYYAKFIGRIVVSFLIYLYFFKPNVRDYFGLANASRWKAIAAQFGICVGVAIAVSFAAAAMN